MTMPALYKRQWQLMWGILFVFFMIWVEYECRICAQQDINKEIAILKSEQDFWIDFSKIESELIDKKALSSDIMPSCFKGQPSHIIAVNESKLLLKKNLPQ